MRKRLFSPVIFLLLSVVSLNVRGQMVQDTLRITLPQAENIFLKNNIALIVQRYSIDSARAAVITAKLYDNPEFGVSTAFYNPATRKFFDLSKENREIAMQYSQLIRTAGKRNKAIALANTGAQLTEYQLYDLLRTLKFTLRNSFYNIYYLQQTQRVYDVEINSLKQIAAAYDAQVQKGNIAEKDFLRIQSQLYTLQAELVNLQNSIDDAQSEFKLLLRAAATVYVVPQVSTDVGRDRQLLVSNVPYATLLDSAYANRYDLKAAQTAITYNRQNLSLQKALAKPDVTVQAAYDRLGSFVRDYNNIGLGFAIPIFNRNQGFIKQAELGVRSSEAVAQSAADVVQSQVANVYLGAVRAEKLLASFDARFEPTQDRLLQAVTENFQKHNISLLEFTDFYDAYKQNVVQLNNLRFGRVSQLEQLNYTIGTILFNQ